VFPLFRHLPTILALVAICVAQSTGSGSSELDRRIERQVRDYAGLAPSAVITLGTRHTSQFAGYEELPVMVHQGLTTKTFNFLLAEDGSKLLYVSTLDLTQDPYARNMAHTKLTGRPVRGNPQAKVTVVVYDDLECPFCARMHAILFGAVFRDYRDRVRFIYKDFPLVESHPWAMRAAANANCLAAQNDAAYWEFVDHAHAHLSQINEEFAAYRQAPGKVEHPADEAAREIAARRTLDLGQLRACLKSNPSYAIEESVREGESLGVSATPTLFVNGQLIDGVLEETELRALFDRALTEAKAPAGGNPSTKPR